MKMELSSQLRKDLSLMNISFLMLQKALMKTRPPGKIPREKAPVVQGFRTPARMDTTSEPQAGNDLPGAPVNAPMSGGASALQPGWNRGMIYSSHP